MLGQMFHRPLAYGLARVRQRKVLPQQAQLVCTNGPKLVVLLPQCYLRLIIGPSSGRLAST